ncbi:MAG: hypothetical protein N5P05_000041 [Chroococcopsis gigantea SAG 12.99]|jgi:hypothetical protein|nr:glycosyltransferase [Chlorogloea purpurea SAG 13.99]MDV2998435.1 hypothetical protein [Chroococcopsis gigantea SAG 12.99]
MEIFHKGLTEILLINNYLTKHKFGFLTIECPLPQILKKITQALPSYSLGLQLRREYRHLQMGIKALSMKDIDSIFVLEAYNQHLLFLLPMLISTGKNIFIGIHGNQQFAQENKVKALGFEYLQFYLKNFPKVKVVLLEVGDHLVPEKFRFPQNSQLVIPHPMLGDVEPRLKYGERRNSSEKIKIGLTGIIRPDKPIDKILKKLQKFITLNQDSFELIIGTPLREKPAYLESLDITLRDTTKDEDYLNLLKELDILVVDYDKKRYYYRASGVISDAVSCGCYIIAPDYPLIEHQITWPAIVGNTFTDLSQLDELLIKATEQIKSIGKDNNWRWREKRSAKYIAELLSLNLDN